MDKLIFLLLFNGLYGYTLPDIPTSNLKEHLSNVEIEYYTNGHKFISRTVESNVFIQQLPDVEEETTTQGNITPIEQWSIVWYVASFGGLIAFFLIVSCSEWCCRRSARARSRNNSPSPSVPVTPPPSYDQFAPPTYDSLNCGRNSEKSEYDIYVVPVHALGTILSSPTQADDDPPSYTAVNDRQLPSPSVNIPVQINQSA